MIQHAPETSSADGVSWDLEDLYSGPDDPRIDRDLDGALDRAKAFESVYRGKIGTDGGPEPALLLAALTELEGLSEQMDRPSVYASLLHAAKTDDPRRGALLAHTRERRTAINKHLIFFDLEWVKVPDDAAARLIAAPELARYRHYSRTETGLAAALPQRAGGEGPRGEGGHRPGGLRAAVRRDVSRRSAAPSSTKAGARR